MNGRWAVAAFLALTACAGQSAEPQAQNAAVVESPEGECSSDHPGSACKAANMLSLIELAPLAEQSIYSKEQGSWSDEVKTKIERRTGEASNCAKLVSNTAQLWAVERKMKILKAKTSPSSALVHAQMPEGVLEVWYSYEPEKQRAVAAIWLLDEEGHQKEPPSPGDNGMEMLKNQLRMALECAH